MDSSTDSDGAGIGTILKRSIEVALTAGAFVLLNLWWSGLSFWLLLVVDPIAIVLVAAMSVAFVNLVFQRPRILVTWYPLTECSYNHLGDRLDGNEHLQLGSDGLSRWFIVQVGYEQKGPLAYKIAARLLDGDRRAEIRFTPGHGFIHVLDQARGVEARDLTGSETGIGIRLDQRFTPASEIGRLKVQILPGLSGIGELTIKPSYHVSSKAKSKIGWFVRFDTDLTALTFLERA